MHAGTSAERARALIEREARTCAIGIALIFAQVEIQPARKLATQNSVHDNQREVVGRRSRNTHKTCTDHTLCRSSLVHQIHPRLLFRGRGGNLDLHHLATLPFAKAFLKQGLRSFRSNIANHNRGHVRRVENLLEVSGRLVAGQATNGGQVAVIITSVRMLVAIKQLGEKIAGDTVGTVEFTGQSR